MFTALLLCAPCAFVLSSVAQEPEAFLGRGESLFTAEFHAGRRALLAEKFLEKAKDKNGVIVLRGHRAHEDYREFRQNNNFWYFTGLTTPDAILVMIPQKGEEYLLVPPVDPMSERWLGDLKDPVEAKALTGITNCLPLGSGGAFGAGPNLSGFDALMAKLAEVHSSFYVQKQPSENWMMSRDNLQTAARTIKADPYDGRISEEGAFAQALEEKTGGKVKDITNLLDALRVVKTSEEIAAMRNACRVSGIAHENVMKTARPGDAEWLLAGEMTGDFLVNGSMGAAYMAIVGGGKNACILHYTANDCAIVDGDVVMIDYGAEFQHYVADISRTWPVGKKFTKRQREVYEAVYAAQEKAFEECKPGSSLSQVHQAAAKELRGRGFGDAFWHGTSHWLGMATHDVGRGAARFEPGMVFTVEPGVYLPEEGMGVRIEDVVVITEEGYELLSSMIPRSIEDIEALRAQALK
jgi:Xaa-Pro aminopeptidase